MIKKIIQFLLVLVFTWTIVFLARQDVNTFAYWFAGLLVFMCVDIAYKFFVESIKVNEKIVEGEDIKLVNDFNEETLIEAIKNQDSKFILFCLKDYERWGGLFVEKNDNGEVLDMTVIQLIVKNENTYSLFQYDKFPLYVLDTNDNGKIIGVNKINNKYVQE